MTVNPVAQTEEQTHLSMQSFLQDVELKAYRIALLAVREHADALDIMQDSMIKLVTKYEDKPSEQWKPLFYRILNNSIMDWHRKQKVRRLVHFFKTDESQTEEYVDPNPHTEDLPEEAMDKMQLQESVVTALQGLPAKQQQCFLLRSWEGLSVAETSLAMGCSEGSVKTHYFRAVNKLREMLGEQHDIKI